VALLGCLGLTYRIVPGLDGMPPIGPRFMANRRITIASSSAAKPASEAANGTEQQINSTRGATPPPPAKKMKFPFPDAKYRVHNRPARDEAAACKQSGICDDTYGCGQDGLGCIKDAAKRREYVQNAARWSWAGYRWAAPARPFRPQLPAGRLAGGRRGGSCPGGPAPPARQQQQRQQRRRQRLQARLQARRRPCKTSHVPLGSCTGIHPHCGSSSCTARPGQARPGQAPLAHAPHTPLQEVRLG
jgi:hypothetical protein